MVLLIGIPLAAYFLIKQHGVQTMLVHRVLNDISEQTGSEIKVGKVRFSFFHDLSLEDVFIADQQKDTLFFAHSLQANFDSLDVFEKKVHISALKLNATKCRVKQFDRNTFNFSFLIDSLFPADTVKKEKWDFRLKSVDIDNGDLAFYGREDYRVKDTKLRVSLLNVSKDSLNLMVKNLQFVDTAGVVLNRFSSGFVLTPDKLSLTNLKFQTDQSQADVNLAEISGDSVLHHIIEPQTAVMFDVNELRIASSDMRRFIPVYPDISEKVYFSGKISGKVGDIRGKDLLLSAGGAFDLLFSISITGLPDFHNSFIFADFNRMFISPKNVIPELEKHMKRQMPFKSELKKFGRLLYTGSLTGFPGDFVAFGELNSELGSIHADVALKDNVKQEKIEISGNVNTEGFNVGQLLDREDELGYASLNVELEADKPYDDYMSLFMNGEVSSLEFHGYNYTNVFLRGVFGNKHFNGGVNINDPNLSLLFTGRIDFSDVVPIFDFEADIRKIAPYQLKLSQKFKNGVLNTQLKTKIKGDALENLEGYVGLYDLKYVNKNGEVSTPNATIFFNKETDHSSIQVNTDWLNGQISGKYKFGELKNSFAEIIQPFLPTLASSFRDKKTVSENQFDFSFRISGIDNIAHVFELPFSVSSSGNINGTLNDNDEDMKLSLSFDKARFKKLTIDTLKFDMKRMADQDIEATLSMNKLDLNNKFLENIRYSMISKGDSIENAVIWKNNSKTVYEGNLNTGFAVRRNADDLLQSTFSIRPSSMTISDSLWNISPARIVIDSTGVDFESIFVNNNERFLAADGKLSKQITDTFNLDVEGFELDYLSRFLNVQNLSLQGRITGQSFISAGFGNPVINSDFRITDFVLNNIYAGDMDVNSDWDKDNRKMNIYGENVISKDQQLDIQGAYFPSDDSLYLAGKLERLPVKYIQPYLETIMQNMQGLGSGQIVLEGNVKHLKLIGDIYLDNGSFDIGYLNTRYFLSDTIHLVEDAIEFNNIKVYDINGHSGTFNGVLGHKTFKDMQFNMFLDFNDMLALNTTAKDNDLYYGTVYGTGVLAIEGEGSRVHMDINARTESNSEIFLPLTSTEVASESGFVRFVSQKESSKQVEKEEEDIELSGFSFNMEVEATPDARVELIFDSRIGDVIKGQGSGTLVFNYDTKSDFKMYGDYTVSSGEYLFTAQNVINKRFDIEPGGVIKWSGDPYNATLNLDAYYRTKAPLYDLLPATVDDVNKTLRVPVNCHMMLTDNLMNPTIKFDVVLPTADQVTQQQIGDVLSSENEVQRQVIYLLMFNRFYTPEWLRNNTQNYANSNQAAVVTASEFASNQLSNMLSQLSDDFDLGVNYRPADASSLTRQEVEMMFSTKMFNDKLTINGNFGYRETQTTASNFVGDFDVDYRLNQKGNFKLKAYSHTNDNIIYENSPTTQGFGFVYKEEFNSFGELVQHYRDLLRKKEENNQNINEDTSRK
ncbi:translocation/assembly module TamB domain-containing protein [Saccharicrinis sp. FJH54]|uniref:translocation/assembly module TamB domain-containing protein n=1 Tax=Saccharicrinis sp. FJH54 TaxID=3344665 RepID=UPI0035D40909